jgi:hypothetical protein
MSALRAAGLALSAGNLAARLMTPTPQPMMAYPPGYYPYAAGAGPGYAAGFGNPGLGYGEYTSPQHNAPTEGAVWRLANVLSQAQGDPLALQQAGHLQPGQAQQLSSTYNALVQDFAASHNMSPQSVPQSVRDIIANEALSQSGTVGGTNTGQQQQAA